MRFFTAFYSPTFTSGLPSIKLLLETGGSLTAKNGYENTPFHSFAEVSSDIPTWEFLCLYGGNTISNFDFCTYFALSSLILDLFTYAKEYRARKI